MTSTLRNVTLEMSLKPFREVTDEAIERVCVEAFEQWRPLIRRAAQVSVLLWTADGSEILTYAGDLDVELEWARYIGAANPKWNVPGDPERKSIHARPYLYTESPAVITYRDLRRIVAAIRRVGQRMTGLPVRVGETFDPGTEFAKSAFKYTLHNEICMADTGGPKSFVCCYAQLNADRERYAGFPDGIPQDTPLGTFLGRQCQRMLTDIGFDYLWFSNGFGFGLETWMTRGPMFDGRRFDASRANEIRGRILRFWKTFRAECPAIPVETRGTNLSTGIDLASDAVPLREIYDGGFNLQPPPNSPWAALNGDFGLELVGYMSHIAELPGDKGFPFRFYTHDPWWHNSPWLDRYGREPHDIYMPLSVSRIDGNGRIETPDSIALLTIDDSHGRMPEQVPTEVIPHLHEALRNAPDQPGPLVWVYPFDEYHRMTFTDHSPRTAEAFFGDWFVRSSIMNGLPLNTVVSSGNFIKTLQTIDYTQSVLVTPVPDSESPLSDAIHAHVQRGGRVILYGPIAKAHARLCEMIGIRHAEPIEGEMAIETREAFDTLTEQSYPERINHRSLMSGGGCDAVATAGEVMASVVSSTGVRRAAAVFRRDLNWNGGGIAWVRGTNACGFGDDDLISGRGHLPTADDPATCFQSELLMRLALARFDWSISFTKRSPAQPNPITCISRHANGFWFAGYVPDTTVEMCWRSPWGAPAFVGHDSEVRSGHACVRMPRAWRRECRVFVEQVSGVVTCHERTAEMIGLRRRLLVTGLKDATLTLFPETGTSPNLVLNGRYPYFEGSVAPDQRVRGPEGERLVFHAVNGEMLIEW